MKKDYPDWICMECGLRLGRREPRIVEEVLE